MIGRVKGTHCRTEPSSECASTLCLYDLRECRDHAAVVGQGIKLDACLDADDTSLAMGSAIRVLHDLHIDRSESAMGD